MVETNRHLFATIARCIRARSCRVAGERCGHDDGEAKLKKELCASDARIGRRTSLHLRSLITVSFAAIAACAAPEDHRIVGSGSEPQMSDDHVTIRTWDELPEIVRSEGENLSQPRKDEIAFRYSFGQLTPSTALRHVRDCWLLLKTISEVVRTRRGEWVGVVDGNVVFGSNYGELAQRLLELRPNMVGVGARADWPIDF